MSNWKNVDDELPAYGKKVLVRTLVNSTVKYFEDTYTKDNLWGQTSDLYVTHWCELPKGCPTCGRLD